MKLYYTFDEIEQFIEINKGQSTIGRSSAATFTIRHDTISKVHTLLTFENGVLTLEDMESSNGTFVNGVKIVKAEVKPNDNIKVGKVAFRIEMTPEELSAYNLVRGAAVDNDSTPAEGVEVVSDRPGEKSETFFDLAELKEHAIASVPATAVGASANSNSTLKIILGNRKNLLLLTGSITVILLMAIVIVNLNTATKGKVGHLPEISTNSNLDKQRKYELTIKEGVALFLNSPDKANAKFKEALKLINNNATSSLIQLSEIWQKGEMNWAKVSRAEFRKNIDDIRHEDEGQMGAILYSFINDMTRLEEFEQKNENIYAEIVTLLNRFKMEDATQKLSDIPSSSIFYGIAQKRIKSAKIDLIEQFKSQIQNARDSSNAQEEVKNIVRLLPMLPAADQKDYIVRKEKLQRGLDKESLWKQGIEKLEVKKDLDAAKQIFDMFEAGDPHYSEANDKLAFIKEENARQNIHTLYDISGEGKAALKIIADTMSIKLNDLGVKIGEVDTLYCEAIRKGEINPDDTNAHTLLEQVIEKEPNPDNEYNKRAKKLLAEWKDPNLICNRKFKIAKEKLKLKDYVNARIICKEIREISADFDISSVMKSIEKYVTGELNNNVRNGRTNEIKKSTLLSLSKIVMLDDKDYDFIKEELMKMEDQK